MIPAFKQPYLDGLVNELRKLPSETPWLEFKHNNCNPEIIGQYISALGNMAALEGKAAGYVIWGIQDQTHEVVGTDFTPFQAKKGGEDLVNWLTRAISPRVQFQFHELQHEGHPIVILEIPRAAHEILTFEKQAFIRVGTHLQKLKEHPQIEREIWRAFDKTPFEETLVMEQATASDVLSLLDYPTYFELLDLPAPAGQAQILERLAADRMIVSNGAGGWNITALGGILFAKSLDSFRTLERKAIRVIVYEGKNRLKTLREQVGKKGYASGFSGLIDFINTLVPKNEVIGMALRKDVPMYPALAIRELVANALIHQDFSITGTGPMIEIFTDRLEVTNPGSPLIKIERFLDTPPRSRNELLASFMRRVGVCEERGSGVDKIVFETEFYQLPAPLFETPEDSTRMVLFAHRPFKDMDRADRLRACYLHACLRFVQRDPMSNTTLRNRLGITDANKSMASRIIADAIKEGQIKPYDATQSKKNAKYIPYWA